MRWAQTVRLNLSNDRQKVDSSDLNWGDSDREKNLEEYLGFLLSCFDLYQEIQND